VSLAELSGAIERVMLGGRLASLVRKAEGPGAIGIYEPSQS
jgi:hypothetical protein